MDAFVGTILPWPIPYAPQGWAFCNGQSIPITQHQALYSLIGSLYGGDDRTYFNLPNLVGRFPVGANRMGTPLPGTLNTNLATFGGDTEVTLAQSQVPAHVHAISNTVESTGGGSGTTTVSIDIPVNTDAYDATKATNTPGPNTTLGQGKAGSFTTNIYTTSPPTAGAHLPTFTANGSFLVPPPAVSVTSVCSPQHTGGTIPVTITPPYLGINYIIALEGIYPQRP